ncbi:MAG: hypothetical protein M3220_09635 [Chloroflexota bacterium]|nr:hypothetical protein [Chloroflexota bacterium]
MSSHVTVRPAHKASRGEEAEEAEAIPTPMEEGEDGPEETITYEFDAPSEPGTYYFQCDVHPTTMTGDFIVEEADS